jgi:hypothetical protein
MKAALWALELFAVLSWGCAGNRSDLLTSRRASGRFGEFTVTVELENEVCDSYDSTGNEAGPLWTFGNSTMARSGERIFVSADELVSDVDGYNRIRWGLYELDASGWKRVYSDSGHLTREPSPIAVPEKNKLWLSANPTLSPGMPNWRPSRPELYEFSLASINNPKILEPSWPDKPGFNHHSYRSLAADRESGDVILFHHDDKGLLRWVWYSRGTQKGQGLLPWFHDTHTYDRPLDLRVCYPAVGIKEQQVHFFGVSDIVEPNEEWKAYKYLITRRTWDYDFRRLFYIHSTDLANGKFSQWVEISSRESTAGQIFPCDLYIEDSGLVHVLWYERALDDRLKTRFFPQSKQSIALNYAQIRDSKVVRRAPVMLVTEEDRKSVV